MDTPPAGPATSESVKPKTGSVVRLLVVVALVALVAMLGYLVYQRVDQNAGPSSFILSADSFPAPGVRTLGKAGLETFTIEEQGSAEVLSVVETDQGYYLITGPGEDQSTLYRRTDIGLEQLTESETMKIDLQVHPVTGAVVYTIDTTAGPHIVVYDEGEETDLGAGEQPIILADGAQLLFVRDGTFVMADIESGESVATVAAGTPFAVYVAESEVAVYDADASAIQYYFIQDEGLEAAYAEPASFVPEELVYIEGMLYLARIDGDSLILSRPDGSMAREISAPGLSLDGLTISAL